MPLRDSQPRRARPPSVTRSPSSHPIIPSENPANILTVEASWAVLGKEDCARVQAPRGACEGQRCFRAVEACDGARALR